MKEIESLLQLLDHQDLIHRISQNVWVVQDECFFCQIDRVIEKQQISSFFDQILEEYDK